MPTFEQLILSPPAGFVSCCLETNKLAESNGESLQNIVRQAWKESFNNSATVTVESDTSLQNIKKVVAVIIRFMKSATPAPSISSAAKILVATTLLTQQSVELILLQIKELSKAADANTMGPTKVNYDFKIFCFQYFIF
jgi:hypothetical protein